MSGPLDEVDLENNDAKKIFDFEIANVSSPKSLKGASGDQNQQNQAGSQGSSTPAGATIAPPVLPKLEPVEMN